MNQNERKTVLHRMLLLIAVACVIMGLYAMRLIFLQLVSGDSFKARATNTTDYHFTVTAARGDIVDSEGKRIAASTTSYNVVLSKLLMGDEDLDAMLQRIVELLEAHGEKWNDSLLIGEPDAAGHYSFTAQADSTSDQKALAAMKDSLGLQQYATADDVMEKLVEDYPLDIKVAVMGCVVNGPGEAKEADLGVAGGIGEGLLIKHGEIVKKLPEDQLLPALKEELDHWS